ncbi:MAG: DJ-1/PfpI family protein [Mediterranea sp.]|jgi:transcriptional regulator GlxA family with amidase domain|nr:DJ-1/PfpI family protein [Mediterranea sp.]
MAKKVAVLAVNPVNGYGLFNYLEAFYENGIPYTVYAVAENTCVKANSGIALEADAPIRELIGKEDEYDALVFACGDAVPTWAANADKPYNRDMLAAMAAFADKGKLLIGHCGAAVFFNDLAGCKGRRVALHPYVKDAVQNLVATDAPAVVDGNVYTAQTEHTLAALMPDVLKALKED